MCLFDAVFSLELRSPSCDPQAMGCSPSALVVSAVRAAGQDGAGSKFQEDAKLKSERRKSSSRTDDRDSIASATSNSEDLRHDSFGRKNFGKRERRNTAEKIRFPKRRNSNEKKVACRQPPESKRKDTPAAFTNYNMGCRKTPQRSSSQIEFFRMLDEKIAQGHDYESDTDGPLRMHSAEAKKFLDPICQSNARSQSVS